MLETYNQIDDAFIKPYLSIFNKINVEFIENKHVDYQINNGHGQCILGIYFSENSFNVYLINDDKFDKKLLAELDNDSDGTYNYSVHNLLIIDNLLKSYK